MSADNTGFTYISVLKLFFFRMRANNSQINFNDERKKEHLRQQEKLKAMDATSDEAQMVSADLMIDNLLKNSLAKLPQTSSMKQLDHSNSELPLWLQCESSAVPAQYKYLWSMVQSSVNFADTQKVSQLLLTSGLPVDVLGFIWNLANKTVPGQLTKQEFYIVLALVSLAQIGYKFSDISILKLITIPSPPILQVDLENSSAPKSYTLQSPQIANKKEFLSSTASQPKFYVNLSESIMNKDHFINNEISETTLMGNFKKNLNNQKESDENNLLQDINSTNTLEVCSLELKQTVGFSDSNSPCIGSLSTVEVEDDFSAFQSVSATKDKNSKATNLSPSDSGDDFTEFQSANVEPLDPFQTVVIHLKQEVPKISLPKTLTGKFSTLKSDILKMSPETEKKLKVLPQAESLSSLPESKISSRNKVSTSISVLGSNHGIGSRLANHLNTKLDLPNRPKCQKHHKFKINPTQPPNQSSDEEIILGVKSRNLETVIPKCRPKYLNTCKTFMLKETKIRNSDVSEPSCSKHFGNEPNSSNAHSGESTRQIEIPMLGTFNETVLPTQSKSQSFDLISVQEDKYSALREIELQFNKNVNPNSKEVNDDFGDFLSADIPDSLSFRNEEKGDWGDWNFNTEKNSCLTVTPKPDNIVDIPKTENDFFDSFELLTIKGNDSHSYQINSYSLEKQDCFGLSTKKNTMSDTVRKLENIYINSKADQTLNLQSDQKFQEFLNDNVKSLNGENFNRHDSLPSLDFKMPSADESEQEVVWRKCLDSCHCLIKDGYKIFNNISTKSLLDEVFAAPKTEDYLNHLNIVFQISKRVAQNFIHQPSTQEELEKFWGRLQDLCFEYNIKLKRVESTISEGEIKCNICFRHVGYNLITQGNSSYHLSCANFWINCIERTLPFSI